MPIITYECQQRVEARMLKAFWWIDFHGFDGMVSAGVSITLNVAAKGIMKINAMLAVVLESKSWRVELVELARC